MIQTSTPSLTLEAFLQLPETKPASEFIHNQIIQKPMPQGEHSTLQGELVTAINAVAKAEKIAIAYPELRCTFGGASIIPDVSVFRWQRIPRSPSGRVANRFELHPDWAIEILSPDQSQTKVLENLLHCSQNGTELGWLLAPDDESILAVFPESRVKFYRGSEMLPVLEGIALSLSPAEIFNWLALPE
ncbi:Uma2 family endonuclease [Oculatella sp. FACHB-28]|uniref:Uma2 family endonuclease n=1 Tax=Oculatella sp. FACHB-28 TaxID=2692845 RepID=UPI001684CCBC|nr:Uma2 family endonuclease [Oculatella sp. FACHB-28]MBD1868689.1 Uma2 family endonuclease [Cyanobacteria bacterium FACHB-471]MBD2057324.1 Uma2 family endonuclease [Oculatella sp. FACHB-28]